MAKDSEQTVLKTAELLSVNPNTLHTWIHQYGRATTAEKVERGDEHLNDELKR
jgi:transposase-like protein